MGALQRMRIVIAGGGVVGWTTALELAGAGASITLADPGGANASSVAAGMLAPVFEALFDPEAGATLALLRDARDRWPGLAERIGLPIATGAVAVGQAAKLAKWASQLDALGATWSVLDAAQAKVRSPGLREGWGGLHTDEDWRIEPAIGLAALRAAAQGAGVNSAASAVEGFKDGRVRLTGGEELAADRLIVATGPSRSLIELAPELVLLSPIKGHILTAPALALSGPVVRFEGGYACPGADGAVIGATMELGRADTDVDPVVVERLKAVASLALPAIAEAPVNARAGVRAATLDGLPLAGPSANPGVWLAVGVRRNGWLLAPMVAQMIADAVSGAQEGRWAGDFSPARFA